MQILLNGIISGSAIALLGVAFQSVYLPTRVFFMGLAGIYASAPFIAYACRAIGLPWVLAIPAGVAAAVVLSLLFEFVNHSRLQRRNASEGAHLISSLGLYIITVQLLALTWGPDPKTLRTGLDSVSTFGPVIVTGAQSTTLVVALALLTAFALFLWTSNYGLRLRAMADNPTEFALFGYDVRRYRSLAFMVSGVFGGVAALVTAYDRGFDPHGGLDAVLLAIVAVIVGGQGSFLGPVIGGFLLGILRAQVVWHTSARWQEAATFALLALFLLVRPQGVFGHQTRLLDNA